MVAAHHMVAVAGLDVVAAGEEVLAAATRTTGGEGEEAALGPWVPRPERLVVRVEQGAPPRIVTPVARPVGREHQLLEEPRGVRQVPLGRAGVGHRLRHLILGIERRGEGDRARADLREAGRERGHERPGIPSWTR